MEQKWGALKGAVLGAMEAHVTEAPKRPRRVWISQETMEMLEHRKALAQAGLVAEAQALDKDIRKAAKEDKAAWVERRLGENFWDPIKEVTRKPSPSVVALARRGKDADQLGAKPAETYAEFLGTEQWGREAAGELPAWGQDPIGLEAEGVSVKVGPIELEELEAAIRAAARGRAPGMDGIPIEAWAAMAAGRGGFVGTV